MSASWMSEPTYIINSNNKKVTVVSDFNIPFETRKSNAKIRDKVVELHSVLKEAIKKLVISDGELLLAAYSENDKKRFYDVENMLFYNIGVASFRECCKKQLAFIGDENRFSCRAEEHSDSINRYYYDYEIASENRVQDMIKDKRVVACWRDIPIDMKIPQSATRYYATIRKNISQISVNETLNRNSLYGMKLEITLPTYTFPASIMKPLLDGIICAFHGEEGRSEETIKKMFGNVSDIISQDTKEIELFGKREYVSSYRSKISYKWNPADERLQFAWIIVHRGTEAKLSGSIYDWN